MQNKGRGFIDRKLVDAIAPPSYNFIVGRPKAAFSLGSLVVIDVACG